MTKNKKILIGILAVGVVLGVGWWVWSNLKKTPSSIPPVNIPPESQGVTITMDKAEYEQGETAKITVSNDLNEAVCFESCNTYYFQKKNVIWREYLLKMCEVNFIAECIGSSEVKEFEIELFETDFEKGIYKIAVPIYIGCQNKEWPCERDKTIYSSEFTIKEK